MGTMNPFVDILRSGATRVDARRDEALAVLEYARAAIETVFAGRLTAAVTAGFQTSYGQEYRLSIRSEARGYQHTLLRAYIPTADRPIRLDCYDAELVAYEHVDDFKQAVEDFFKRIETQDALNAYAYQ